MRLWPLLVAVGCDFTTNPSAGTGDGGVVTRNDAAMMAQSDAPHVFMDAPVTDTSLCFGSQGSTGYYFCLGSEPTQAKILPGGTYDTGSCTTSGGVLATLTGPNETVCVIAGAGVTINAGQIVHVIHDPFTSSPPFVIASTTDITIAGTLDASAIGPNSDPTACNTTTIDGANSSAGGGGGGAGGSFGTQGGNGGLSGGGSPNGASTIATGTSSLRGGCRGGFGGNGNPSFNYGLAGAGGGAVFLVARGAITISGVVNVSGGGGGGGGAAKSGNGTGGGGGGGGSGGMLLIDATTLAVTGMLVANGGGGGGGGGSGNGANGQNPNPTMPQAIAKGGGNGGGGAGSGGNGAAGTMKAMNGQNANTNANNGGGGGGGGQGLIEVIHAPAPPPSPNISPTAKAL